MAEQVYFEDLHEGQEIPTLVKKPDMQQLVQWAAGSGGSAPIHYDADFARSIGLPGVIVSGELKCAFLGQALWELVGRWGKIRRYGCSYRGIDLPSQELRIRGQVRRKYEEGEDHLVELELSIENSAGQTTVPGTALVCLPSRR